MKPVIGISLGYDILKDRTQLYLRKSYSQAVNRAGGIPVLLPPEVGKEGFDNLKNLLDGLVLSGGGDVDPHYFKQDPHPELGLIDPGRDEFEINLARQALNNNLPLLAICRGLQVMNIVAGGKIFQDLDGEIIQHQQQAPRWHPIHRVEISPDSRLEAIFNKRELRVNSFHHQALAEPLPGFEVIARAPDGVIEAIINRDHPLALGVQWHPEGMIDKYPEQLLLFKELIKVARGLI
ncbi:MAG: gamma-glutamyl-gamma-aminobutyrate hydrolase family protein [Bacillota bacterium]